MANIAPKPLPQGNQARNDAQTEELLGIVRQIEKRLVGGLDTDDPGLITEIRVAKIQTAENFLAINRLKEQFVVFAEAIKTIATLTEETKELKLAVEQINKSKWITYGFLLGIGAIMTNLNKISDFIRQILGINAGSP